MLRLHCDMILCFYNGMKINSKTQCEEKSANLSKFNKIQQNTMF